MFAVGDRKVRKLREFKEGRRYGKYRERESL